MNSGGQIDKRQLVVLVTLTLMGSYFLTVPRVMAHYAGSAGWLGPLFGSVAGIINAFILTALHRRFPEQDFTGIAQIVLGPVGGKLWALLFFAYTLIIATVIREFATTILTPFLPDSPIGPVIIIMGLLLTYLAYSGIESIARTAQVFLPLIVISLLLLLITALSTGDLGRIQPWLGKGWKGIGQATLNSGSIYGEIILFAAILPHLRRTSDNLSGLLWGIFFAGILLTLITIGGISLFGYRSLTRLAFPAISTARTIRIGTYFERMEALFIIIWFNMSMLKMGLFLYAAAKTLAGTLNLPEYKPLVVPTVIFLMLLVLLPATDYSIVMILNYFTSLTLPVTFILPGLLLAVAYLRKKGEQQ